jgi:hypothetical protein
MHSEKWMKAKRSLGFIFGSDVDKEISLPSFDCSRGRRTYRMYTCIINARKPKKKSKQAPSALLLVFSIFLKFPCLVLPRVNAAGTVLSTFFLPWRSAADVFVRHIG